MSSESYGMSAEEAKAKSTAWAVTYADLVTLLLTFFILLLVILNDAEKRERDSNQILEFTKEVKNKNIEEKKIVIEALWNVIYSDENADMYETNLMRRLSGLLYLDPKIVGDIKEKIKFKR